ncbi:hypothetical protein B0H13DRAFT_2323881 [Mycena leptocephala]|nr:hypothetical protein B0H13DRAFT_2323881 [Mycena leptocephala]
MHLVSKIFSSPSLTQAVPAVFCAMLDDSELVKHFPTLLKALKARIKALPASLPLASLEALFARYLGDLEIDAEEGARSSANRERTFQVSEDEQRKRITLGKYGMNLVCPFLEFYYTDRTHHALGANFSIFRSEEGQKYCREQLGCPSQTTLKYARIIISVPDSANIFTIAGVSIAVERLFSGSKHTMSDARSSVAASTASSTVITKELLNAGFDESVDYLEGITIH